MRQRQIELMYEPNLPNCWWPLNGSCPARRLLLVSFLLLSCSTFVVAQSPTTTQTTRDESSQSSVAAPATTVDEARARAKLIHELIVGTLLVVHRDLFDDENPNAIPSASLEDVFREMGRTHHVNIGWLNTNLDIMNVDHQPKTEFEKLAAKQLPKGQGYLEELDRDNYQFAGPVRLGSQCLKCHLKDRRSNEDRISGLVITMPLKAADAKAE